MYKNYVDYAFHGYISSLYEKRESEFLNSNILQVDLVRRHCFPVYWNGENRRVLRGHWFGRKSGLDWLPLREDVSEQLEYAYRTQVHSNSSFGTLLYE